MKTIDLENHFATEMWVDALSSTQGYPRLDRDPESGRFRMYRDPDRWEPYGAIPRLLDLGRGRIEEMDAAGVDVAALSLSAPGVEHMEPALGMKVAKNANDVLAAAIDAHPDRFLGFATLAPKDVDSAVAELERAVKELGFKGWNTHSNFGDSYLDDRRYWPLLAKVEELGVPIYVHPTVPRMKDFYDHDLTLAASTFGFGVDASFAMMRLIMSGAFDAFPGLAIILGHYGEALPFLLERVDRRYQRGKTEPGRQRRSLLRARPEPLPQEQSVGHHERQLPSAGPDLFHRCAGDGQGLARHRPSVREHERVYGVSGEPAALRGGHGEAL